MPGDLVFPIPRRCDITARILLPSNWQPAAAATAPIRETCPA
jgi:hypothetical protein